MEPRATPTGDDVARSETSMGLTDMIVKTPGTCGGRARVAGTRIKVEHIYNWVERQGLTPAAVVAEHPHLNLAQVHAALAYYWSHREEIESDIAEGRKLVSELQLHVGRIDL
jgi:uncharacterized protein (DUF433 family)